MEQKHIFDHYEEMINEESNKEINPEKSWEYLQKKNKNRLDNIAISEDNKKTTYGDLFEDWKRTAQTLSGYDVSKENNSRVLIVMPNLMKLNSFDYGSDITGAIASFPDPTIDYEKMK